ncbi:MAG: glycosyltransferase family 9 protein [Candidatus Pacebacteria bacterium]|nr:glycosyltransferase family 9 protein [Candidatus Paceibacterota bacterium]
MFNKKYKNLIYFQNGSIGDFLMTIFFLENIYLNDNSIKLNVVIPKNEKLLLQFLAKYSYINIILANRKSVKGLLGILKLSKFAFSKNLIITAPTPGKLSWYIKIIAKKISLLGRSELVGFDDGQKINKFIYTKLLKYNTKIIYPDFLKTVLNELDFEVKKEIPKLEYTKDEDILKELGLEKEKFIVFNPIAATKGRSFREKEINEIIDFIKNLLPKIKIVLTGGKTDEKVLNNFKDKAIIMTNSKMSELCTVIDDSELFIGVDTGTAHIASFLGQKSLIIAQNGTPNWLPYYNPNATILYKINNYQHNIYEGREHLESCRGDVLRCLGDVPLEIIKDKLRKILL